jgi:hypothetical protein
MKTATGILPLLAPSYARTFKEAGKGSHRKWRHQNGVYVVMSGNAGHDAHRYQERQVVAAIAAAEARTKNPKL